MWFIGCKWVYKIKINSHQWRASAEFFLHQFIFHRIWLSIKAKSLCSTTHRGVHGLNTSRAIGPKVVRDPGTSIHFRRACRFHQLPKQRWPVGHGWWRRRIDYYYLEVTERTQVMMIIYRCVHIPQSWSKQNLQNEQILGRIFARSASIPELLVRSIKWKHNHNGHWSMIKYRNRFSTQTC